jgi:hypothetical protein
MPNITRNCSPAMSTTSRPAIMMRPPVPRSGWMMVSPDGTQMMTPSASSDFQSGGNGRSYSHQAQHMGTASFMISEG